MHRTFRAVASLTPSRKQETARVRTLDRGGFQTMTRRNLVLLCAALVAAFSACHIGLGIKGSGVRQTEKRELAAFKSIDTTGSYAVEMTGLNAASFEIEAD